MSKDFFQRKEVQEGGFEGVEIDVVSKNPVVTLTQALYEGLTARELSFVVAKDIVAEIMDQAEQQLTQEEE